MLCIDCVKVLRSHALPDLFKCHPLLPCLFYMLIGVKVAILFLLNTTHGNITILLQSVTSISIARQFHLLATY